MNSDQERALFEAHGWRYDYVARDWVAPVGGGYVSLTLDDVVELTETEQGEEQLRQVVERYGVAPEAGEA